MDADLLIRNGRVVTPAGVLEGADLAVSRDRVEAVGRGLRPRGRPETVDAAGLLVWPGLVDLHVHGARGEMVPEGGERALRALSAALASEGVTRFLPTLPPLPPGTLEKGLESVARASPEAFEGAAPLGIHLEGPYLNPERSGALPPEGLRAPDAADFRRLVVAGGGKLRLMTLAPELPGAAGVMEAARGAGVALAAGHTEASHSDMEEAVRRGLSHVTHCFNAMRGMSHRSPGPAEAALTLDGLTVEVIADGHHVHRALIDVLLRCRGTKAVCLVSDATALQAPDGVFTFFGRKVEVRRGLVRDSQTGALGGSALSLWDAIRNMRGWFGLEPAALAQMAALNPARVAGADREVGSLEPGKKADFVLADPEFRRRAVYRDGRRIWSDTVAGAAPPAAK
ncbi:MAG: N-acetylglucosamine-6-phosphate deacetylase, partial [Planctomycetes bacterium]|nr:N-acetylglucosamine-6-phosphate deacetylase [Planctomycetota bacterium]